MARPKSLSDVPTHYCPGCLHGIIHRVIAEVIDELGVRERTIGVASVGCSVLAYDYFDLDFCQAPHGRAPAVATGIKRANPDNIVFTYQGDGDLAAIGTAEIIHAILRQESITTIFVNNAIYGMTGGQMAPTTLIGQKTTSSPTGRDVKTHGHPLKVAELVSTLPGIAYVARYTAINFKEIKRLKKAIHWAFLWQQRNKGYTLVEILSNCPTNWKMTPTKSLKHIEEKMLPEYPLGCLRGIPEMYK